MRLHVAVVIFARYFFNKVCQQHVTGIGIVVGCSGLKFERLITEIRDDPLRAEVFSLYVWIAAGICICIINDSGSMGQQVFDRYGMPFEGNGMYC